MISIKITSDAQALLGKLARFPAEMAQGVAGALDRQNALTVGYVSARKLWREVEEEDRDEDTRWWRPALVLLLAMALLATVLSLAFDAPGGALPASLGGVSGLLGAGAIVCGIWPAQDSQMPVLPGRLLLRKSDMGELRICMDDARNDGPVLRRQAEQQRLENEPRMMGRRMA